VLQQPGDVEWLWSHGDRDHYWGFSVRPFQANDACEIVRMWVTSDNELRQTTHFVVRKLDGIPDCSDPPRSVIPEPRSRRGGGIMRLRVLYDGEGRILAAAPVEGSARDGMASHSRSPRTSS